MEYQERLHLILSCLRDGGMTGRGVADSSSLDKSRIHSVLASYRLYGYIYKRRIPNKKRYTWSLTGKGKKKLESLDLKFAPDKTAIINLNDIPYSYYKKIIIKNGNNKDLELIPQIKI